MRLSKSKHICRLSRYAYAPSPRARPVPSPHLPKGLGCTQFYDGGGAFSFFHRHHNTSRAVVEERLDLFSLVADELSVLANRLCDMVVAEVPKLASAAEYFFKFGVERKRFRPTILLLMANAINVPMPTSVGGCAVQTEGEPLSAELRTRQQCIAEITEMIHVASLLHDDVLDDVVKRRGVGSLNFVMGNKLSVLAGDFLLSRACVALASLKNTEVVSLLATVAEHLVTGETMQMTSSSEQRVRNAAANPFLRNADFFRNLITKSTTNSHIAQIHAQLVLNSLKNDIVTITKLAQKLSDFNAIRYASLLCHTVPKPDIFLFNVLIRAYSHNKNPLSAVDTYIHIRRNTNLKPDNFTYAFILSALDGGLDERLGLMLHSNSIVDGFGLDVFVGSAVVDFYFKFSQIWLALKVFDEMSDRDTVLWNTVISGLARNSAFGEAVKVFMNMLCEGAVFDSGTLATVLPAAAELQDLTLGKVIQCLALKVGIDCNAHVLTGLVSLYAKCGDSGTAEYLFGQIRRPDLISCNAMISGYTCNNYTGSAVRLFKELLYSTERVNSSTIVGLIPVHSPFGFLNLSYSIHAFSLKSGLVSNPSVSTAITTVYSRLNEIETARKLFDECSEKTLAGWNAMISGYTQNGLTEQAITLFQQMQESDIHPNPVTVTSILSACAQLGALTLGKWVHEVIVKEKLDVNVYVSTALIDMYAKCGSIEYARQLFNSMTDKNVVTWNAMISGYGLHGHGHEALSLLNQMFESSVIPTEVTFVCALYACSHAGLVKEGNEIFHSMVHDYGMKPLSEHYACMVDIFGRAGQLNKAMDFITGMPSEPGPAVWGTMLGACMIHKDKKLAHIASNKLFEFEGKSAGYYVLLSNIYSSERSYAEAALVRQTATEKQLAKTPGCTLIEISGKPHVFTSGDQSHPQSDAIYEELEKLMGKMREAGFQTVTTTALHDIEEEEKEISVKVHSEKLAIAFGLISLERGTEIRIIKNLRVCVDCHTATKFISKLTKRVIVVRDANRFHHFKEGVCSCGDYW